MTPEETSARWAVMHTKYKDKILDLALLMRGFYVKLGQLGAQLPDIVPTEWLENLRFERTRTTWCIHKAVTIFSLVRIFFSQRSTSKVTARPFRECCMDPCGPTDDSFYHSFEKRQRVIHAGKVLGHNLFNFMSVRNELIIAPG